MMNSTDRGRLIALAVVLLGVLTSWAVLPPTLFAGSGLGREPGAIYFEDIVERPIKLKVVRATNAYVSLEADRLAGVLVPNREVELVAMSDRAYKVRGQARHDRISGWVRPSDLDGMTDKLKENLKKLHARQLLVEDLIKQKQVALGMTMGEVERAMGGAPTKKSSKIDKDGRKDTYEYITYKNVPVYSGTPEYTRGGIIYGGYTYVKVEDGKVTIEFADEMVTSIEESEGEAAVVRASRPKIVPAPIVLY